MHILIIQQNPFGKGKVDYSLGLWLMLASSLNLIYLGTLLIFVTNSFFQYTV